MAREALHKKHMQLNQQRQNAAMQAQMQSMGQNASAFMNGGGGQMNEAQRSHAMMMQMSQMPHVGGGGVQGLNGNVHNPHLNGGGMNRMQ